MRLQAKGKTSTLRTGKNTNMMQKIYQPSQSSDKNETERLLFQISVVCTGVCAYIIYMDATLLYKQKVFFKISKALFTYL